MPAAIALTADQRRWFDRVVRMVCDRLRDTDVRGEGRVGMVEIHDRVVTLQTLQSIPDGAVVTMPPSAIVTPAAKDELRQREIEWSMQGDGPAKPSHGALPKVSGPADESNDAIAHQLRRRNVPWPQTAIELSDDPETAVWGHHRQQTRAAVCHALTDVPRLQRTFAPEVWVVSTLDRTLMETINLVAAIDRARRVALSSAKPR